MEKSIIPCTIIILLALLGGITLYKIENERISMIYSFPMNHTLTLKEKDKIAVNTHQSKKLDMFGIYIKR